MNILDEIAHREIVKCALVLTVPGIVGYIVGRLAPAIGILLLLVSVPLELWLCPLELLYIVPATIWAFIPTTIGIANGFVARRATKTKSRNI